MSTSTFDAIYHYNRHDGIYDDILSYTDVEAEGGRKSFTFPKPEPESESKKVTWQCRQKTIVQLLKDEVLTQADVLLNRTTLKSTAKLMQGTILYRESIMAHRMLYHECGSYSAYEQQEMVREIYESIVRESGRFLLLVGGTETTASETITVATYEQTVTRILHDLTCVQHPFPSMGRELTADEKVDLPQKTAQMAAKRKDQQEKNETAKRNTKKARTTTGQTSRSGENPAPARASSSSFSTTNTAARRVASTAPSSTTTATTTIVSRQTTGEVTGQGRDKQDTRAATTLHSSSSSSSTDDGLSVMMSELTMANGFSIGC